jgi:DNA-binding NtrC family response regulator
MATESTADEAPITNSLVGEPRAVAELRLVVISGPDREQALTLRRGSYTVGKARECDLVLSDPGVSRRHLVLRVLAAGVEVEDLGSKNGSFLRSARFRQVVLGAGEIVTIGETELKLVTAREPERRLPSTANHFGRLLGRSVAMREVFALLERIATTDAAVLIEGETGTGKDLCAESLHAAGSRAAGPFVVCDLAAVAPSLLESELFGHTRGAFTGADRDHAGAFASAEGGTLFIDEIGELEMAGQPRLLRALEARRIKPIGADGHRPVDVRVIAATNRDLDAECRAGRFRADLFHRLAVLRVRLPPLRARKEDVALLARHFVAPRRIEVAPDAIALLTAYDWPGNVRELRNIIVRATAGLADGEVLSASHLELGAEPPATGTPPPVAPVEPEDGDDDFHAAKRRRVAAWERSYLTDLLHRAGGNISRAARRGGLDRPYLHRLLKKHGLWSSESDP